MSETAKSQDDLSIEEILGSIRRIIAEDDDDQAAQPVAAAQEETVQEDIVLAPQEAASVNADEMDDEEPLELTNKIEPVEKDFQEEDPDQVALTEEIMAVALEERPADEQQDGQQDEPKEEAEEISFHEDSVIAVTDRPSGDTQEPETEQLTQPEPISAGKEEMNPMTNSQDDSALKDNALLSSNAAIATAAVMAKLARQAAITEDGNSNVTLEAMVKEMIRPMLREWLDANLPDLVQKMVERELERLTKRL